MVEPCEIRACEPFSSGSARRARFPNVWSSRSPTAQVITMAKKKKKSGKTKVQKTPVPPRPSTASKPSNRREKPKEEKPVGYILQLSQDSIVLTDSEKVVIGIRVMRVADNGQTTVASNAEISLQQQKDTRLLLAPHFIM